MHTTSRMELPPRDPKTPIAANAVMNTSLFWGAEGIWTSRSDVHNPMFDGQGRLWVTARVRPPATPAYCRAGSSHPSAKRFPIETSVRQVAMYDPKTKDISYINTCFDTHHLMFAEDANNTLWFNGYGSQVLGWINTKMFDETHDEVKSQGWTGLILDTNGNGKRDAFVKPNQPIDPSKDKQIDDALYTAQPAPDGSIWGSVLGVPGAIIRVNPGPNPTETALAERYEVPWNDSNATVDTRRAGWMWIVTGGVGRNRKRSPCKLRPSQVQSTAQRTEGHGQHCAEGWPSMQSIPQSRTSRTRARRRSYFAWWISSTARLGRTRDCNGNESDGFLALKDGKLGCSAFRTRWELQQRLDGRIDDRTAAGKGEDLSTVSTEPVAMETGRARAMVMLPASTDPLAK